MSYSQIMCCTMLQNKMIPVFNHFALNFCRDYESQYIKNIVLVIIKYLTCSLTNETNCEEWVPGDVVFNNDCCSSQTNILPDADLLSATIHPNPHYSHLMFISQFAARQSQHQLGWLYMLNSETGKLNIHFTLSLLLCLPYHFF